MINNTISYIEDLYNDKLTDFRQDAFFIEYRNLIINNGEDIKSIYLMDTIESFGCISTTIKYFIDTETLDKNKVDAACKKYNVPMSSLNLGKHIIEYIRRTSDSRINTSDFYLDTYIKDCGYWCYKFKDTVHFKKKYFTKGKIKNVANTFKNYCYYKPKSTICLLESNTIIKKGELFRVENITSSINNKSNGFSIIQVKIKNNEGWFKKSKFIKLSPDKTKELERICTEINKDTLSAFSINLFNNDIDNYI